MSSPIIASDFFDDYDPAPAQCPDYEGTSLEELTPKTVDTLTRLVDFANVELLTTRYYRLLRANKPDQYKTDTEGDIFCQLHHDVWESWLESEQQELLKDTHPQVTDRWRYFVERELGLSEFKNWKRYRTLLSNDTWRACAADWTSYDMGRATFKVHQFTDAASLFLDEFFVPLFTNTLRKLDKSLGAWSKRILADDLKLLTQLKEPYHNLDTLRELAFPLQEDDPKSKFGTNKAWFIGSAEYTTSIGVYHVKLGKKPLTKYTFRRPGFCINLEKSIDFSDFISHLAQSTLRIPSLEDITEYASMNGKTLSQIARHAIYWADPLFQQPGNADAGRKDLDYVKLMDSLYPPRGSDSSSNDETLADPQTLEKIAEARKNNSMQIKKWCLEMLNLIRTTKADFSSAVKAGRFVMPEGLVACVVAVGDRRAYRENLYYSPWRQILSETIAILDTSNFKGVMTFFHKYPKAHLKGSSQARVEDALASFYARHENSRMLGLKVDISPYYHADRVNDAARHAIFQEELRTALLVLQDVDRCRERLKALNSVTSQHHSLEELPDDEDDDQGSGLKRVGGDIDSIAANAVKVVRDRTLLLKDFGHIIPTYTDNPAAILTHLSPAHEASAQSKLDGEKSDYEPPKIAPKTPKRKRAAKDKDAQEDNAEPTPKKARRSRR